MRLLTVFAVLLLAGCTAVPKPAPRPAPRPPVPAQTSAPRPMPLAQDWRDWPYTPGDWVYLPNEFGSEAVFGQEGQRLFVIACNNDGRIRFMRPLDTRKGGGAMVVRTSTMQRTLPVNWVGHPPTGLAATLMPRDGLLDAIGFSRGRFVVEQAGHPTLVMPSWAEIERVTEDCRR